MELTHTRILVDRYKECFLFYRDVLGFKVGWGDEESNYADFEFGGVKLGIFNRSQMAAAIGEVYRSDKPQTDRVAFIFKVEDVARAYEEWEGKSRFHNGASGTAGVGHQGRSFPRSGRDAT